MEKKEISIDPSLFGYGGIKKGRKGSSSKSTEKKKKEMLVNVNGGSVKELLLRKLREYKKNKTKKLVHHHENNNQSRINPDFLERIKRKKNKTENSIVMESNDNMFQNVQNTYQSRNPDTMTSQFSMTSHPSVESPPPFGIMKNGNLPTYRSFHNRTMKSPQLNKTRQIMTLKSKAIWI